jgi:hypothetical protein
METFYGHNPLFAEDGGILMRVYVNGKLAATVIPSKVLKIGRTELADINLTAYLRVFPFAKVEVKGIEDIEDEGTPLEGDSD